MAEDERFVSEPLEPVGDAFDARAMARGEPGLPAKFKWRGREYRITELLEAAVSSGPGKGGMGRYLRKHWYTFRTETGEVMTCYFDRQAKSPGKPKVRWWLYSVRPASPSAHRCM